MNTSSVRSFFSNSYILDSAKLLILGSLIETGRRLCQWLMERFRIQYSTTVQFQSRDPAYEWIILFLTQEGVWRQCHEFQGSAKSSQRKWDITNGSGTNAEDVNADYVPTYRQPQLFRWNGYWLEIHCDMIERENAFFRLKEIKVLHLTVYSLDMGVISALVQEARSRYMAVAASHVTVHISRAPEPYSRADTYWPITKTTPRRPIDSIILGAGTLESLLQDANEFLQAGDWYREAGIPHHRGYLLFGPPGTGKSSTIYALAGELGLEVYSLSLSSTSFDDSSLQEAVLTIPKRSILLLEDIDCAFPTREDSEDEDGDDLGMIAPSNSARSAEPKKVSNVTLATLLNIIDGLGSEEGKLFIATTNHIDRLDPALLRPGRIDRKVEYCLATKDQAAGLFLRFFPASRFATLSLTSPLSSSKDSMDPPQEKASEQSTTGAQQLTPADLISLSKIFADAIPPEIFSTAELQGYLLSRKTTPAEAAHQAHAWVEEEEDFRRLNEEKEAAKKNKIRAAKSRREAERLQRLSTGLDAAASSRKPGSSLPTGCCCVKADAPSVVAEGVHPGGESDGGKIGRGTE